MSNIERLRQGAKDFKSFARSYLDYVAGLLSRLDVTAVNGFLNELEDARKDRKTVFVIGNGGSAVTASHMANDLGFGTRRHVEPAFRVISLTDNLSVLTAIANDVGYEEVFLRQLQVYFNPGDKLIVISASGNSANLVKAAEWVKAQGGKVLGLLGFDGGKLKNICDAAVVVETPPGEYGPVEDVHMILDHLVYSWLWSKARNK